VTHRRCVQRIVAIGALLLTLNGCGPKANSGHAPPPAGWPNQLADFTIVWSAEPGIELTTGAAVAVRAYLESYELASATGDERYVYPGFAQATDDTSDVRPRLVKHSDAPWVGSERNRVISLDRAGADVHAVVCSYMYGSAQREQSGGYTAQAGNPFDPNAGIYAVEVTLMPPPDAGQQLSPQAGPARAPSVDVFRGWRIAGRRGGYSSETGGAQSDLDACVAKAPDSPERRAFLVNPMPGGKLYHPRSDFPTLPAYPGWPAAVPG
jgi:hypothetical protein